MARAIALPQRDASGLSLNWSGRLSLTRRILLVNIVPLALLAASFFYIDGFRAQLIDERRIQAERETQLIGEAFRREPASEWQQIAEDLGKGDAPHIRVADARGNIVADSWASGKRSFTLRDPSEEPWERQVARFLDETIDWVVGAQIPPPFLAEARFGRVDKAASTLSLAPDRSHMIEAHAPMPDGYSAITLRNARDIRRLVRAERSRLGYTVGASALLSILLSLFLARTIVRPLQRLAEAANLVRYGQAREVAVPRLPSRSDEIGSLARSVSDMSHALRVRIDAIEAFAADVAHELKNPLASLRSATEILPKAKNEGQRRQLLDIVTDDVGRMDRLITDISELSRIDARIARTRFERVDLGALVESLIEARSARQQPVAIKLAFARPAKGSALVLGDTGQLNRVIENLIDNAISFSPPSGTVRIAVSGLGDHVLLTVDDDGPGIPEDRREAVFERFHSDRPEAEFGRHSGLGLAIARTIIEAHHGSIVATEAQDGSNGARLAVSLPAADYAP